MSVCAASKSTDLVTLPGPSCRWPPLPPLSWLKRWKCSRPLPLPASCCSARMVVMNCLPPRNGSAFLTTFLLFFEQHECATFWKRSVSATCSPLSSSMQQSIHYEMHCGKNAVRRNGMSSAYPYTLPHPINRSLGPVSFRVFCMVGFSQHLFSPKVKILGSSWSHL